MRAVINRSWTRETAFVTKGTARGKTRKWSLWCPKSYGMIGRKMDASTLERCIIIQMKKKLPSEQVEKLPPADAPEFDRLRQKCLRWSTDNKEAIAGAMANMTEGFGGFQNRASD